MMVEIMAVSPDIIRWTIFLTFIFLWLFGGVCIVWLNHLSNKTHKTVVDIDRRLTLLESRSHIDTSRNSSDTE